jgi:hypothetical protein
VDERKFLFKTTTGTWFSIPTLFNLVLYLVVCSQKLARLLSRREQNDPGQGKKAVVCHRCARYVETEHWAEAQKNSSR